MAEDRTGQTLNVYSGATKIASAAADKLPAHAKLDPGDYAAGAFKGTWQDADGNESDKVDFPALTIPVPKVAVTGATITPASGSVDVGKTVAFSVAVAPDNATDKSGKWSIKDTSVGTIDDKGTVTGVKAGTTEVDFTTTDGSKLASAALTVTTPKVAVTGVTVAETNTVDVGKTVALKPTIAPDDATDKSVTYASSDESVAKVGADGTVTGVKAGTADITVTTTDGGKTAKCTITVNAPAEG